MMSTSALEQTPALPHATICVGTLPLSNHLQALHLVTAMEWNLKQQRSPPLRPWAKQSVNPGAKLATRAGLAEHLRCASGQPLAPDWFLAELLPAYLQIGRQRQDFRLRPALCLC